MLSLSEMCKDRTDCLGILKVSRGFLVRTRGHKLSHYGNTKAPPAHALRSISIVIARHMAYWTWGMNLAVSRRRRTIFTEDSDCCIQRSPERSHSGHRG